MLRLCFGGDFSFTVLVLAWRGILPRITINIIIGIGIIIPEFSGVETGLHSRIRNCVLLDVDLLKGAKDKHEASSA